MIYHQCDVLVVGAGGAGLRAAVAASEEGAKVVVVSKPLLGKSQTVMGAALAAVLRTSEMRDSWEMHFADTVRGGRYVNQWRMAQLLAQESPERVLEMEQWGAPFDRAPDGNIRLGDGSGHRMPRLARAGHRTGMELLRALQYRLASCGIETLSECVIVELLKNDARIAGAFGYLRDCGRPVAFLAPAVVVASGGLGKAYAFTSNFYDSSGDGQALACRAGADLTDMEFVQFHPTGMVAPTGARGLLVAESIRNFGGVFLNAEGERFMFRYVPEGYKDEIADNEIEADAWFENPTCGARRPPELLPRDDISLAIEREIRAGRGTRNGGVVLDIASRRTPEFIKRVLPHMVQQFMELAEIDISREPMEVAPTCHYAMGGIRVDPDTCSSTVGGLFAAGEAAGGLHGANRLNGNGLSELLVFGRRAGFSAARFSRSRHVPLAAVSAQIDRADRHARVALERSLGESPYAVQHDLQRLMQQAAGLTRSEVGLSQALSDLNSLRTRYERIAVTGGPAANPAWQSCLDLCSLLTVSEAILRSALLRRESRGAHVREDFPEPDPILAGVNTVTRETVVPGRRECRLDAVWVSRTEIPQDLKHCLGRDST